MAEYNVTAPDGTKYRVTGPEGASDEQILAQIKAYKEPTAKSTEPAAKPAEAEAEPSTLAFIGGNLSKGVAQLGGLPVDFARNVLNLGIAGAGTAIGAMGGKPPDLIPPAVGGSQSLEALGKKAGVITPAAEPESVGGKYAAAALQAVPSALIGKPSMQQLRRAVTGAVTSGLGAQAGADIAPEGQEAVGAALGSLLPGAASMAATPAAGERAAAAKRTQRFGEAKELGIPVPPRLMKPDPQQQKVQNAISKELKLPEGTELSPPVLQDYRAAHYREGWLPVVTDPALGGQIVSTPAFRQEIRKIALAERRLRSEFPNSVKDIGLQQVLIDFVKPGYTTEGAMSMIKRLREGATRNLSSPTATDDTMRLGLVQRKIATAMEDLVEQNAQRINKPELVKNFREARKAMAQAHNVEAALDPVTGKVNAYKIAALQAESGSLTGQLKRLAEVTAAFPKAVKPPEVSDDVFTKRVTPMAVLHPPAMSAHLMARLFDPITTSRAYQSLFVDPRNRLTPEQQRLMRLVIGSQQTEKEQ